MKKIILSLILSLIVWNCETDKDDPVSTTNIEFTFKHNWNNTPVTKSDFNSVNYTNSFGNQLSIERLRYLISKVTLTTLSGEQIVLSDYNLLDLNQEETLTFNSKNQVALGVYSNISFTFGFSNEDNIDGAYQDLNSASWNVPMALGGGYHYMQLDGKYQNSNDQLTGYNFHAIRAVDNPGDQPSFPQNTYFQVNLGEIQLKGNDQITTAMNIAKWFEDPYSWDLNVYDQMLMPNSEAQILMYQNGQNVFSLINE